MKGLNRKILTLALPNILSNITVPLLGIVDLALAGHLDQIEAIGSIAIATTVFNLIYWNFAFLRMGTTGMTAQALGRGDKALIGRLLIQSLLIAAGVGMAIALLRTPLLRGALWLLSPEPQLFLFVEQYFYIVVMAAPAVLLTYALNGWVIGMQNTWLPMLVSLTSHLLNISLSAYWVLVTDWGIAGIAYGTLAAHYVGVVMLVVGIGWLYLCKGYASFPRCLREVGMGLSAFFSTNAQIFLRTLLLIVVTLFFTYAGTQAGTLTLSTNTILLQFFTLFSYFTDGFAYAGEALVGLHYGAKERVPLRQVIRRLMQWGAVLALLATLLYFFAGSHLLRLLTDKDEIIANAAPYMVWIYLVPLCGFAAFLWDGIFIGLTATREMLWSMLVAVVLFFTLYYIAVPQASNHALWAAFLLYLAVRGVVQTLLSRHIVGVGPPFSYTYYIGVSTTITSPLHLERVTATLNHYWPASTLTPYTYSSDATGKSNHCYANAVLRVESSLTAEALGHLCKQVEAELGRDRSSSHVALDLDVVVRDTTVLRPRDYAAPYFEQPYLQLVDSIPPNK